MDSSKLNTTIVTITSANQLHQLDIQTIEDPWSENQFASSLQQQGCWAWGVAYEGQLKGYALAMLAGDDMELLKIGVLPESRRQGYGEMLLNHLYQLAGMQGCTGCVLEVRASNTRARKLYEKNAFECVGRRKDYYPVLGCNKSTREDAWIYRRLL